MHFCRLNSDVLGRIGEELWGKDLCSIASTCGALRREFAERVRLCKRAEACVRRIRLTYSLENHLTMETQGLLRFTQDFIDKTSAREFLTAYRTSPSECRIAHKYDFLTTYTTQYLTTYQLTTDSVVQNLIVPYVED